MPKIRKYIFFSFAFLILFLLFTFLVQMIDVRPIGPQASEVGFAMLNGFVFAALGGYHAALYFATELLGLIPILTACGFALCGALQLLHRRSFRKVDHDLYVLAGLYILLMLAYVFFKHYVVNCRPVDFGEGPEASYPSSHTILAICVMLSAAAQFDSHVKRGTLRRVLIGLCCILAVVITAGRFLSGVHWCTDIIGALLLSGALVFGYFASDNAICVREKCTDIE